MVCWVLVGLFCYDLDLFAGFLWTCYLAFLYGLFASGGLSLLIHAVYLFHEISGCFYVGWCVGDLLALLLCFY